MVLTIATGVALGILIAAVVMLLVMRWGPKVLSACARSAKRYRRAGALALYLGTIAMMACAIALFRADRVASRVLGPGLKQGSAGTSHATSDVRLYGAAFRQANMIGSWHSSLEATYNGPLDPTHDPFKMIRGTDVEVFWERFVTSRNEAHTREMMQRLRIGPIADRKRLQEADQQALLALSIATFFDIPTLLLGVLGYLGTGWITRKPRAAEAET